MNGNNKVVVVLGTTASGKTKLAVALVKKFNGEIISADSRQVYKGMDVGTGKDLTDYGVRANGQWRIAKGKWPMANSKGQIAYSIPYHLIDVVSPKQQFTVGQWQEKAYTAINDILSRGKLPIVVGGTGLYIAALTQGYVLPQSKISKLKSKNLRLKLDKLSLAKLLTTLKRVDPETHSVIDKHNRVRVQRALEIYYQTGQPKSAQVNKQAPPYSFLLLGLTLPKTELKKKIEQRLKQRLDHQGLVAEVKKLHRQGLSWKKLESFGLEYRYVAYYLQGKINYDQMVGQLAKAIIDFAKRQMTWFKRDKKITWVDPAKAEKRTSDLIKKFLKKSSPY